jgi:hypothetical protein
MVSAMDRRHPLLWILSAALAVFCGCNVFHEAHDPHYETVQADPRHETAVAEDEHAQALKFLNKCPGCQQCDLVKAEEHLQKALVADVTYGPAHNTLGMLYLRQRRLYLAAWEFEYAQRLMSDRFEPLYNLGLVYEAADKLDRAIEFYSMAFSISPRTPDVLESLVRARLRNGETVANVRPLLKEIIFYETRPVWVCWAKERLGLAPEETLQNEGPPLPLPANDRKGNNARKKTPEPPEPDESPGLPPKIAAPNPKNQLSSTKVPRNDVFSDFDSPSSSDAPASDPLAVASKGWPGGSSASPIPSTLSTDTSAPVLKTVSGQLPPSMAAAQSHSGQVPPATSDTSVSPDHVLFGDESFKLSP